MSVPTFKFKTICLSWNDQTWARCSPLSISLRFDGIVRTSALNS